MRIQWTDGLFVTGWLAYIVSMFLPALTFMGAPLEGWRATLITFAAIGDVYKDPGAAYIALTGISNIVMIFSPVLVRKQRGIGKHGRTILFVATLSVGSLLVTGSGWDVGYYMWLFSFVIVTVGMHVARQTMT